MFYLIFQFLLCGTLKTNNPINQLSGNILMKKVSFLIFISLLISYNTYSQITITAGTLTAKKGDSLVVPISVTNFTNIGAITLKLQYDPKVLTWGRTVNVCEGLSGALAGQSKGVITFAWDDLKGINIASGKLFDFKFLYNGGTTDITFTAQSEISDINGNIQTIKYTNGNVKPAGSAADIKSPSWILPGASFMPNIKIKVGSDTAFVYKAINTDGGTVTYKLFVNKDKTTVSPDWITLNQSTGLLKIAPPKNNSAGEYTITIGAYDGVHDAVLSPISRVNVIK